MWKWASTKLGVGLLLLNLILLVAVVGLLLHRPSLHYSKLLPAEDYQTLSIEDLAMRFRQPEMYGDLETTRSMAFAELMKRHALHKNLEKADVEFLLGVPYNLDDNGGEPFDTSGTGDVWKYSNNFNGLVIEFKEGKLQRIIQTHDGDNASAHDEILLQ